MTAEIAILNRTAVALAADSVVTLSGSTGRKTYDSAEKIFDLSRSQPVGLMVYNNAEFFGIPIEILAREFREKMTSECSCMSEICNRFLNFMLDVVQNSEIDVNYTHFHEFIDFYLEFIYQNLMKTMVGTINDDEQNYPNYVEICILESIDIIINDAKKYIRTELQNNIISNIFIETYGETIKCLVENKLRVIVNYFSGSEISDRLIEKFNEMAYTLVISRKKSPVFTGLVFAGFGYNDRFSSLYSVEIDGIYYNQIRVVEETKVNIDCQEETGAIIPFAQRDMPERFIYGIDMEFEETIRETVAELTSRVLEHMPSELDRFQQEQIKNTIMERFSASINDQKKQSYDELKLVVKYLSKKELAEVSYSLVELTSRKRRYSSEMETVGGPIDVAILTRNEGFIWVKRKRYFDVDLNPSYMERLKHSMEIARRAS